MPLHALIFDADGTISDTKAPAIRRDKTRIYSEPMNAGKAQLRTGLARLLSEARAGLFTVMTPTRWTAGQDFSGAQLVLGSLSAPSSPLDAADAAIVGAPWLGMPKLRRLLRAATGSCMSAA